MSDSGGATGGPVEHWPIRFSVWPTQFIDPLSFLAHPFFVLGPTSFLQSKNVLMIYIFG